MSYRWQMRQHCTISVSSFIAPRIVHLVRTTADLIQAGDPLACEDTTTTPLEIDGREAASLLVCGKCLAFSEWALNAPENAHA